MTFFVGGGVVVQVEYMKSFKIIHFLFKGEMFSKSRLCVMDNMVGLGGVLDFIKSLKI